MSQSAFAFFRGSAIVQATDLRDSPVSGTMVQLCGDCHLMNFGGFATPERNLVFDINDFDETFPGPWEWDVKRLAVSTALAARSRNLRQNAADGAVRAAIASYRQRMSEYANLSTLDVWYAQIGFADVASFFARNAVLVRGLRGAAKYARRRTSESLLPKLTAVEDGRIRIVDDPPLVYHFCRYADEWQSVNEDFFGRYRQSLQSDRRWLFERYRLEDIAIKVVGIGSVGTRCAIALFLADGSDPLFLQLKEARRSVLEAPDASSRYAHQGERVVVGQRLMQAASDIFLGWAEAPGAQEYYVRQLRDMKVSVDIDVLDRDSLKAYGVMCGWALARAHAKAGDAATIAGYLGTGDRFDRALTTYAAAYADQVESDYAAFLVATRSGRLSTQTGDPGQAEFLP